MRSWLKWGLPLALVVLLGAAGGGVLLAQNVYGDSAGGPQEMQPVHPADPVATPITSPLGIKYTADAAAHPDQPTIQLLLDNHFNSINSRSYDLWKSTVVSSKWAELPYPKWMAAYDTTEDMDWTVQRIDPGPDGSLLVLLTFISTQDLSDAPAQLREKCVTWNVVYPLIVEGRNFRLDTSKLPNSALLGPCKQ